MDKFGLAQDFTAKWEDGLSDDAADKGGLTHWGVSYAFLVDFARDAGNRQFLSGLGVKPLPVTHATIRNLDTQQARAIFKREFRAPLHLDDMPVQMGVLLYDAAVNSGRGQSVKLAQRGYNACVGYGTKLAVDGILGPLTRAALTKSNYRPLRQNICTARENFYKEIVRNRPNQSCFLDGWLNRVADLREYVEGLE